jgi:hypothetical protein
MGDSGFLPGENPFEWQGPPWKPVPVSPDLTYTTLDKVYFNGSWYAPAFPNTRNVQPDTSSLPLGALDDGKIKWVQLNDPVCGPESSDVNCRALSTNPQDPATWHMDGVHSAYWPDYSPYDVVFGCGGVTLYDNRTLLFGSGPETWRFTAKDYVIEGQRVFWVVTWTRTRPPNATQDQFAAAVENPTTAMVDALNTLLKKEGSFDVFKP